MTSIITATCGKEVLVDAEDYDKLSRFAWNARVRDGSVKYVRGYPGMIHRYILGLSEKDGLVDHINRNPLDNRKINLRITSKAENAVNTEKRTGNYSSKYKGVTFDKNRNLYRTRVNKLEFGSFSNEIDAANAYNFYVKYLYEMPLLNQVPPSNWYQNKVFKGVSYYRGVSKTRNRWSASVWYRGKANHIGVFDSELEAVVNYNRRAIELGIHINKINLISNDGVILVNKELEINESLGAE